MRLFIPFVTQPCSLHEAAVSDQMLKEVNDEARIAACRVKLASCHVDLQHVEVINVGVCAPKLCSCWLLYISSDPELQRIM